MRFGGWGSQKETETQGFDGLGYLKVGDFGGFWSWGFGGGAGCGLGLGQWGLGLGFARNEVRGKVWGLWGLLELGVWGGAGLGGAWGWANGAWGWAKD